ncbi:MAG TPA: DMT family protein [Caulobacteraceae bacterium]|nr:DMT family protein [Caulobacteraceae bacterium]
MPFLSWPAVAPWVMLTLSNVFMTTAWYGHLKFRDAPLSLVIIFSWLIAGLEYSLAVPANRIGAAVYSAAQLKAIQEVITLAVFVAFSFFYLGQPVRPMAIAGFVLILAGASLVFFQR